MCLNISIAKKTTKAGSSNPGALLLPVVFCNIIDSFLLLDKFLFPDKVLFFIKVWVAFDETIGFVVFFGEGVWLMTFTGVIAAVIDDEGFAALITIKFEAVIVSI